MQERSALLVASAIIIAGILFALSVHSGLNSISRAVERKDFAYPSMGARVGPEVVSLSGDRFAVVEDGGISVYSVDQRGTVSRTGDVDTNLRDLRPRLRRTTYGGESSGR